jgi:putative hydrolase of the HAD superfamily
VSKISAVFSDVGGVLLSNGWDHGERARLVERYALNAREFEERHHMLSSAMDAGQVNLDQYLDQTLFYAPRPFSKQNVRDFMFAQSEELPGSLALYARIAQVPGLFLATLNNESRELNVHRIERFRLRDYFSAFLSSCYLGVSKPEPQIYQLALDISHRHAHECVFIDDRPANLDPPRRLGFNTIQFQNPRQLESDLRALGLKIPEEAAA